MHYLMRSIPHKLMRYMTLKFRMPVPITPVKSFWNQPLLDGSLSVFGKNEKVCVLAGEAHPYLKQTIHHIVLKQLATVSTLTGSVPLTEDILHKESMIELCENGKTVH